MLITHRLQIKVWVFFLFTLKMHCVYRFILKINDEKFTKHIISPYTSLYLICIYKYL